MWCEAPKAHFVSQYVAAVCAKSNSGFIKLAKVRRWSLRMPILEVLTSVTTPRPILTSINENIDETRKEREGFEAVNVDKLFDLNQTAGVCLRVGSRHKS